MSWNQTEIIENILSLIEKYSAIDKIRSIVRLNKDVTDCYKLAE